MVNFLILLWSILPGWSHPDVKNVKPLSVEAYIPYTPPARTHAPASSTILTSGSTWRYLVTSGDPDPGWKSNPLFNDTDPPWYGGPSPLGYGGQGSPSVTIASEGGTCVDECVGTVASPPSCKTCTARSITTYFRKKVNLTNVSGSSFTMRYQRDDGIVLYINGTEVIRENMPLAPAPISYTTLATAFPPDPDEVVWVSVDPARYSSLLTEGQNLITTEIHQYSATSSDIRFNLELIQSTPTSSTFTTGAIWQYLVTSGDPDPSWKSNPLFNDTNPPWYDGASPLGYGEQGDIVPPATKPPTVVDQGGTCLDECVGTVATSPSCKTCTAKSITTYFRKKVNLANVAGSSFSLRYQRDDGILVYINGTERVRENLPAGTITYSTTATAIPNNAEELTWVTVPVQASWFAEGQNLIAVEIHQTSATSSDIRFNMELLQAPNTVSITRGPYLQLGTSSGASSGATVRWRTNVPTTSRVTFGLSATSLTGVVNDPTSTTEHEVRLTGLQPDRQYFYSVGTTSGVLEQGPNNYFKTAPLLTSKRKIRIATFGDVGTNVNTNQAYVRDAFLKFRTDRGDSLTNLWMLTGDNSYDGADSQYQTNFFNPFKSSLLKNTMLYTVPGNHDYFDYIGYPSAPNRWVEHDMPYYDMFSLPTNAEAGGFPSQSEQYYSFDYGPIHFVMLDSYGKNPVQVSSTSPKINRGYYEDVTTVGYEIPNAQIKWLKQDLEATTQKWKIVYMHHPPYTRGTHDSEAGNSATDDSILVRTRERINPILERFGVDMVVSGHSHVYERSYPLHDHYGYMSEFTVPTKVFPEDRGSGRYDGSPNTCPYKNTSEKEKQGTVYVVSGSSGALEPTAPNLGLHPAMVPGTTQKLMGGSFYMEVEDNRLDAKFLLSGPGSYTITDQFTMMKDVDKTQSLTITNGQSATLSASFISDYVWSSPTSPTFTATDRSVVVTPTTSTTYVVRDSKNCLLDTYVVQVTGTGTMFTVKTGNWNDPTVWSGNRIPVSTDMLQIKHNVTIPASLQAHALSLKFDPATKLIYGLGAQLLLSL